MSLEETAYRLIRIKARNLDEPVTDEQLGEYVRGVVDLQTEIWDSPLLKDRKNGRCSEE